MDKILAVVMVALFLLVSVPPMASTLPGSVNDETVSDAGDAGTGSGDGGVGDAPWPMFSHDLRHTGRSPYDTSLNIGEERWRFATGEPVISSPAITKDGTIYVGGRGADGPLCALYSDGTLKWRFETPCRNGRLGKITSSPAIGADGTVYVGSWNGYFYAVGSTGALKWRFDTRDTIHGSAAVGPDGTVYFGVVETTEVGTFYALYPNGTEKWRFETGRRIYSSPAIGDDGTIYIGSNDGYLYALYPNGSLRWRFETGSCVQSSPAIDNDGTIYVGSWDSYLYALHPDGSLKWRYKTKAAIDDSSPALYEDTIYVGSYDGSLYALRSDGSLKWRFKTGTSIIASPAVDSDGIVYISSMDGKLYALNPDGSLRWSWKALSSQPYYSCYIESSPAIGRDGTVYIGSWFGSEQPSWGYLHAIKDGIPKGIQIARPKRDYFYLFNCEIMPIDGPTMAIGWLTLKAEVTSPEQVEQVGFFVDGELKNTDSSPPFRWTWNERIMRGTPPRWIPLETRHLALKAYYQNGDIVATPILTLDICNPFGRPTVTGHDNGAVALPPPLSPDARYAYPRELAGRPENPGGSYRMEP